MSMVQIGNEIKTAQKPTGHSCKECSANETCDFFWDNYFKNYRSCCTPKETSNK